MRKHAWSDDDRAEYDLLVTNALAVPDVAERRDVFLTGLDTALDREPPAPWAIEALTDMRTDGADRLLKSEQSARRPRVAVARNGKVIGKVPREMGRRRRDKSGAVEHARTLFDFMTWDDIREWINTANRNVGALETDVYACRRLLALEKRAPKAATPAEACTYLGTTVEEYLADTGT